ncbi:MAG: 50S ribosomal protein L17 [Clostridiales bacterium]|nr:50S ribosomal protein L17 [Clostridiales bacterium]
MAGQRKLGRESAHREMLLRNLVTSLIQNGRIETTEAKAKEAKRMAEKMITLAKKGDLHARRQVLAYMTDKSTVNRMFAELAEKYQDRNGGYTRIVKIGPRRGDAAEMVILELV